MKKACNLRYKDPHNNHKVTVLIINMEFYTEEPNGVGSTFNIILFPDLSLSSGSKLSMVGMRWYTALDISNLITYADTPSLLQLQKFAPIVGME